MTTQVVIVYTIPIEPSIIFTNNNIPKRIDNSKRNTKITLPEYKRKPNESFISHADNASKTENEIKTLLFSIHKTVISVISGSSKRRTPLISGH